jgi:hypothetical protein
MNKEECMIAYSRFLLIALLLLPLSTLSATLQAEARAATKEQAQRKALSDLAIMNVESRI